MKLIIGEHSISGVRIASGLLTKEFEYDYSEITEIKTSFIGTFLVRVMGNGFHLQTWRIEKGQRR